MREGILARMAGAHLRLGDRRSAPKTRRAGRPPAVAIRPANVGSVLGRQSVPEVGMTPRAGVRPDVDQALAQAGRQLEVATWPS